MLLHHPPSQSPQGSIESLRTHEQQDGMVVGSHVPWALSTRPCGGGGGGSDALAAELAGDPAVGGAKQRFQGPSQRAEGGHPSARALLSCSHPGDRVHLCHRGHRLAHSVLYLLQRPHCQERHPRYVSQPRGWKGQGQLKEEEGQAPPEGNSFCEDT